MSGHYRNIRTGNAVKIIQISQNSYSLTEKQRSRSVTADELDLMIQLGELVKERELGSRRKLTYA
jgi:hypothetical protein